MNIHPLFVHFPIALLSIATLLEFLRMLKFFQSETWINIKTFLLVVGIGSSFLALQTGEMAEEIFQKPELRNVLELHSLFANLTVGLYGILAAAYGILWISRYTETRIPAEIKNLLRLPVKISALIVKASVAIPLSLIAVILLTITGALGGALVYGPEVDPIVSGIYHLFF